MINIVIIKINNVNITKNNSMENINNFITVIKNYFKQNSNSNIYRRINNEIFKAISRHSSSIIIIII